MSLELLYSKESEQAVLACALEQPSEVRRMQQAGLRSEHFYDPYHRLLFEFFEMRCERNPQNPYNSDFVTSWVLFRERQLSISDDLFDVFTEIRSLFVLPYSVDAHLDFVIQLAERRNMVRVSQKLIELAYNLDAHDLQSQAVSIANTMRRTGSQRVLLSPSDRATSVVTALELRQAGQTTDVSTGFSRFDKALGGGFIRGTSNIITAIPGGYKTTFCQSMARLQALMGYKVLYISHEMPDEPLSQKDLSAYSGIDIDTMRIPGAMSISQWKEIMHWSNIMSHTGYYTWPYTGNMSDIERIAQDMAATVGLDEIIIDYIQITSANDSHYRTRYDQITEISGRARDLGKSVNAAVVLAAQMSRAIYGSADMIPHPSYLKESGNLENDATFVGGLYSPVDIMQIPGKYVPQDNMPLTEAQWRASGASTPPALDAYMGMDVPPIRELQMLVGKSRMCANHSMVRLGVEPVRHRVFDPYRSQAEYDLLIEAALQREAMPSLKAISPTASSEYRVSPLAIGELPDDERMPTLQELMRPRRVEIDDMI